MSHRVKIGLLLQVQAYDADEGDNGAINYSISLPEEANPNDLPFAVDRLSGWITTTKELDRETQSRYEFTVSPNIPLFAQSKLPILYYSQYHIYQYSTI